MKKILCALIAVSSLICFSCGKKENAVKMGTNAAFPPFEWIEGNTARFGLVRNDFDTQTRTVNKSGRFYAEIIENNGVTDEMFDKYVKDEEYTIR